MVFNMDGTITVIAQKLTPRTIIQELRRALELIRMEDLQQPLKIRMNYNTIWIYKEALAMINPNFSNPVNFMNYEIMNDVKQPDGSFMVSYINEDIIIDILNYTQITQA